MQNVFDTLKERGFVQDVSDEAGLRRALEQPITLYCGYDPTAPSFHIGNLVSIMMLAHFQRHGHRPIALMGGGTGMIGDPTGRTSQRPIMTREEIESNLRGFRAQLGRYLDFAEGHALMLNNADWLLPLHYIEFLRDIGRHFSVNQMLATEAYRTRMETGLSFIEFNYMLLQSFDFLHQFREYGCILQIGGSDQWANCLAGADLIRRVDGAAAFVLVAPLITLSSGQKMGKSEGGAIWLDPERTTPYEFYQFWINTPDSEVERRLAFFTFLPMDEVRRLGSLEGAEIRAAKEVLAFEATKLTHGEPGAEEAQEASRALFGGAGDAATAAPSTLLAAEELRAGMPLVDLLVRTGLAASKGAARTLILQGGAYVNGRRIDATDTSVGEQDLSGDTILLRAGKKRYHRVVSE
jgi:tyrosyl-tRNA synthetase